MSIREVSDEVEPAGGEPAPEVYAGPAYMPVPVYTYVILACIIAVTAAQFYVGLEPSILAAGFVKPEFLHGHYWRILTGAALHGGLAHIAMNGYALYSFGRIFELLTNRAHLAIVFLLAAVSGGILSLIFLPDGISVGASGGIVGLIGYLVVYAYVRKQFISREFRRSLVINIGFIILFGLALFQVVDNWGHIGGLLAGAIYGFIQIPRDPYVNPANASNFAQIAGLVSLGIFIATSVFSILVILRLV